MSKTFGLSKRERQVAGLLLQGKSNKQIAAALDISESTVEFHLTRIYTRLDVASRSEAILRLGELGKTPAAAGPETGGIPGSAGGFFGESPVENEGASADNEIMRNRFVRRLGKFLLPTALILILAAAAFVLFYRPAPKTWKKYEREAEHPDAATVGQTIARSNASGASVHGQFGSISVPPWTAQAGSVTYANISTPAVEQLYLQVHYSKKSPASVPVLVYIDDEDSPRASFLPKDQGDWDQFAWTEPIYLGSIASGVHSVRFATDGQQYGVADLDKFVLTAGYP